jgi:hypothetical protein
MTGIKLDLLQSATISADTVLEIIKHAVEQEAGKKVKSIKFNHVNHWDGLKDSEHIFTGITVRFQQD